MDISWIFNWIKDFMVRITKMRPKEETDKYCCEFSAYNYEAYVQCSATGNEKLPISDWIAPDFYIKDEKELNNIVDEEINIFIRESKANPFLWEYLTTRNGHIYAIQRNIYFIKHKNEEK